MLLLSALQNVLELLSSLSEEISKMTWEDFSFCVRDLKNAEDKKLLSFL
jgi:hypothetical protein